MRPPNLTRDDSSSISPRWLWFAIIAPPIAWAVQGLFGWYFGGADCANGSAGGGGTLQLAETCVSIAMAVVAIVGLVKALGNWRHTAEPARLETANGRTTVQYLSAAGALISGIFLIAIVWAGVGAVIVNACGSTR